MTVTTAITTETKTSSAYLIKIALLIISLAAIAAFWQKLSLRSFWDKLGFIKGIKQSQAINEGTPLEVPPAQNTDSEVIITQNIAYGEHDKQKLDLCEPKNKTTVLTPGIILIHGGNGDKSAYMGACKRLAAQGYIAAAINFREEPAPAYPMLLDDGKLALSWLINQPGVDQRRLGALGGSGGGWISSMLGTQEFDHKVDCVVNQFGPTDYTDPTLQTMPFWVQRAFPKLFAATIDQARDTYINASPLTHLTANDAEFLLTRSLNDHLVPRSQAERFLDKLAQVGKQADFIEFQGTGNGHALKITPQEAERVWNIEIEFLDSCLAKN